MAARSLYEGTRKFDREQLIFMAEVPLAAALDQLHGALPHVIDREDRQCLVENARTGDRNGLQVRTPYEQGVVNGAATTLAILGAQLVPCGVSVSDALKMAGDFDAACARLLVGAWCDGGEAIRNRDSGPRTPGVTCTLDWLYGHLWPNTRRHAEAFVDKVFKDYLAEDDE